MRTRVFSQVWATCLILYFLSQILFLVNIQFPPTHNFDEFHYVPAAKELLATGTNRNWEHPPLGKEILALGIALWGDRPIGWRFMSTVFGALTLVGMYLWALALFRRRNVALWVAALTFFNHLLYVQARIGMLDTFLFAFLVWALAAFTAAWDPDSSPNRTKFLLYGTGILLGLATAAKWSGVVAWATCIGLVAGIYVLKYLGISASTRASRGNAWYDPGLWPGMRLQHWLLAFLVIPVVVYLVTFLPFGAPGELLSMQKRMWEGQLRVVTPHPYMSNWWDWAILKRPIWYAFDREPGDWVRGVLLLGNPFVMWTGLLALVGCIYGWLRKQERAGFLILAFYVAFYFSWIFIPRKISFYYYYYPAGMVLGLALAYCFELLGNFPRFRNLRYVYLGIAAGVFFYFFPILAALRIRPEAFRNWMWFSSWI